MLSVATFLYLRCGDELPDVLGEGRDAMTEFHRRSTECLLLSHYSKPSTYTIETLLLNIQCEFIRNPSSDSQVGVWAIAGIVTRLAMRMGFHRDAAQYPRISCFQGEMRRRIWAVILQLDGLISADIGLPRMIQEDQYDTSPPSNLFDHEFSKDSASLPPSRPETTLTPVLYTIVKGRLLAVFGSIDSQSSSVRQCEYTQILHLHNRLQDAHSSLPDLLQNRNIEESITVPASLIIRRYNLELLFQKAMCVLHRHHMLRARHESEYLFSRYSCIDAAMKLLKHQAAIHREIQVGGVLHRERWAVSSLEHHNFILAAMIVSLELSLADASQVQDPRLGNVPSEARYDRAQLVDALQSSHRIWEESKASSREALQAFNVLSIMLDKVAGAQETSQSQHISTGYMYNQPSNMANEGTQGKFSTSVLFLRATCFVSLTSCTARDSHFQSDRAPIETHPSVGGEIHPSSESSTTVQAVDTSLTTIGNMIDMPDMFDWVSSHPSLWTGV